MMEEAVGAAMAAQAVATAPAAPATAAAGDEKPEDPVAALLLLAGLVDEGGLPTGGKLAARPAAAPRARAGTSSGGSANTLSKLPSGNAAISEDSGDGAGPSRPQRPRRAAAKRRRHHSDDDSDYLGEDPDSEDSDIDMGDASDEERAGGSGARRAAPAAAAAAAGSGGEGGAAAAAAAGEGEGAEGAAPPGRKRPPKSPKPLVPMGQRKYVSSQITISILEQEGCFNMTQVDAARHLGFGSSTVLKKVMRRLGIKQWPYRKRTSAKKITNSLEEYMRKFGDPAKVEAVLERVRMELAVYEASPTGAIPLRPELAALRQRLYKLDNKVKHEFRRDQEAPLRQCVHSLVEKTWQELQPSWMADLARQEPMLQPLPDAPASVPALPTLPLAAGGADGGGGGEGSLDAAQAVMLAMLMAQQSMQGGAGQAGALSDLSAATRAAAGGGAAAGGAAGEPTPTTQQLHGPAATPEEAAAMVAALAPEPEPAAKQEQQQQQQQQVDEGVAVAAGEARVATLASEPAGDPALMAPPAGKKKAAKAKA